MCINWGPALSVLSICLRFSLSHSFVAPVIFHSNRCFVLHVECGIYMWCPARLLNLIFFCCPVSWWLSIKFGLFFLETGKTILQRPSQEKWNYNPVLARSWSSWLTSSPVVGAMCSLKPTPFRTIALHNFSMPPWVAYREHLPIFYLRAVCVQGFNSKEISSG